MASKYTPKKIDLIYEQVEVSEETQVRINHAFDVLFEATLRYMRKQKQKEAQVESNQLTINSKQEANIILQNI